MGPFYVTLILIGCVIYVCYIISVTRGVMNGTIEPRVPEARIKFVVDEPEKKSTPRKRPVKPEVTEKLRFKTVDMETGEIVD